jgi:hypothetical protein
VVCAENNQGGLSAGNMNMKSLRKLTQLLLIVVCAVPVLANATAVNISRPNDYSYMRSQDPRKSVKLTKVPVASCCSNIGLNLLSPTTNANTNLVQGNYQFGQFESSFNPTFTDKWTFSLAGNSKVTFTLSDQDPSGNFSNLLSMANLELKVVDKNNTTLGSITNNHSLDLMLAANDQYSFLASGSARGKFGGFYFGKMDVTPAAVPIGGTFPMFTAALLLLGRKFRLRARGLLS